MKINTVCGQILPDELGITLPHEHLLVDLNCRRITPKDPYLRRIADMPVTCSIISDLQKYAMISKDSLRLNDINMAMEELEYFKAAGGSSLVDQTCTWIGGNPVTLRKISQITGIDIIATSGYYSPVLPENIDELSINQLADRIVKEITEGFEGTDIRAGIIGEIGTSWPVTANEIKTLRAACRAQLRTGAALSIHTFPWGKTALELLDLVEAEGVDLGRVVICHLDHNTDFDFHKSVAARGAYVEYDRCGIERYGGHLEEVVRMFPRDADRVRGIAELIAAGYVSQILLSQDVCMKIELKRFGGPGYGHVLRHIVPMMRLLGVSQEHIDTILVENPKRMLSFSEPT